MQLETFKEYPRYQALAVLRYGELIGDFLSKHSEGVVLDQNKGFSWTQHHWKPVNRLFLLTY